LELQLLNLRLLSILTLLWLLGLWLLSSAAQIVHALELRKQIISFPVRRLSGCSCLDIYRLRISWLRPVRIRCCGSCSDNTTCGPTRHLRSVTSRCLHVIRHRLLLRLSFASCHTIALRRLIQAVEELIITFMRRIWLFGRHDSIIVEPRLDRGFIYRPRM